MPRFIVASICALALLIPPQRAVASSRAAAVPEAAWKAMHEQEVELVLDDERIVQGKIIAQDAKSVTLIEPSREVTVVQKKTVTNLRAAPEPIESAPAASEPPPLPSTPPAVANPVPPPSLTPTSSTCVGLDCVLGAPADTPPARGSYDDRRMRQAGLWTMVGGASGFVIGGIMLGVGLGTSKKHCWDCDALLSPDERERQKILGYRGARVAIAGMVFMGMGGAMTIAGGAVFGVANARIKNKRNLAVSGSPLGLTVRGRF